MWDWYEWDSIEDFNTWHQAICLELNYPLDSYNQATGELEPNAAKTTEYTKPLIVEDKVIAIVEEKHAENLVITLLRLPVKPLI